MKSLPDQEDTGFWGEGGSIEGAPQNGFGVTPYFPVRSPISGREMSKSRIQRTTQLLASLRQLVILVYDWSVWFHLVSLGITWYHLVSLGITWYQSWYQREN